MQEHKQIQLYVGLEEGGCVDVGVIKLDGFTLIATSEIEALRLQNEKLDARLEMLLSEFDDIVSVLGCEKDNVVDCAQETKHQRDALGKQLLIAQSTIATHEDFHNSLKTERDAALQEAAKAKTMLEGFRSALEIGIENKLSCAELKKAIQLAGAKAGA